MCIRDSHKHEWLILKTSHQIVSQRNHAPWCVVCRVIIPRNNIHLLSPLEIVKTLEGKMCIRDRFYGMVFQDSDVAKWLEGVAYSLIIKPDAALEKRADDRCV